MILADKIMILRKRMGWSQEELADRLDVSRQSVSKWEGNLSTPEIDKIIAMSELFGVSTDYLLKEDMGEEDAPRDGGKEKTSEKIRFDSERQRRVILREEADRYLSEVSSLSWRIAIGVMLCILSPIALILLGGISDFGWISEGLASGLGLGALFLLVAAALLLFIPSGMCLSKFEYMEKEQLLLDEDTRQSVADRKAAYEKHYILILTFGVLLCVLGVAQLVILACTNLGEFYLLLSVCALLALCAVGVLMIVRVCMIYESFQKLLQEGEFSTEKKKKSELISNLIWGIVLAVYLAVSIFTGAWHLTWVIWPVAAVASPIIDLIEEKKNRK